MKANIKHNSLTDIPNIKKIDYTFYYFTVFFLTMCFARLVTDSTGTNEIYVFHFNSNLKVLIIFCVFYTFVALLRRLAIDHIAISLISLVVLGIIPFAYAEITSSYWGNYFPILIAFTSYFICRQSKADLSDKIYTVICIVSVIISLQVIITEYNIFSSLSFANFNNVTAKAVMNIPIGSSNMIAAYLLPLTIFIITYSKGGRKFLPFLIIMLSLYALILCRSKNAISVFVILLLFICIKKVVGYFIKDRSVNGQTKILFLTLMAPFFAVLVLIVFKVISFVISDLQFTYYSPIANPFLNYLDTITSGRISVFQDEIQRFTKHIFLGNGFGAILGEAKSHNWIIELLVQRGFIGLFIYLYCIISIFKNGMKYYRNDAFIRASINLLLIIFIQGLAEVSVFSVGFDFLIWSTAGFLMARVSMLKKNQLSKQSEDTVR